LYGAALGLLVVEGLLVGTVAVEVQEDTEMSGRSKRQMVREHHEQKRCEHDWKGSGGGAKWCHDWCRECGTLRVGTMQADWSWKYRYIKPRNRRR